MKYVALLRGINVGGNNIIQMSKLIHCFTQAGFNNVVTHIASGNVIFDSDEKNKLQLATTIETLLSQTFSYRSRVAIVSLPEMERIIREAPNDWTKREDSRKNIAFIMPPLTVKQLVAQTEIQEGVDDIKPGLKVVYMTTILSHATRSAFVKLIGKKIYKDTTIRTYKTSKKILELMKK